MRARSIRYSTTALCVTAAALSFAASTESWMQTGRAQSNATSNPACAVLSVEEVKTITGYSDYRVSPGDPPGQSAGGGSSCQYAAPLFDPNAKGPLVSLVLIEGRNYTRTVKTRPDCKKEAVAGVGDEAFFENCPSMKGRRTPALYVKTGAKDIIIQIDIQAPETEASMRPKAIALAKAAAAKLR